MTSPEAQEKILALIGAIADGTMNPMAKARGILDLAEAWAWLESPSQPHGGGSKPQQTGS